MYVFGIFLIAAITLFGIGLLSMAEYLLEKVTWP